MVAKRHNAAGGEQTTTSKPSARGGESWAPGQLRGGPGRGRTGPGPREGQDDQSGHSGQGNTAQADNHQS
jgi:hypothetical protein